MILNQESKFTQTSLIRSFPRQKSPQSTTARVRRAATSLPLTLPRDPSELGNCTTVSLFDQPCQPRRSRDDENRSLPRSRLIVFTATARVTARRLPSDEEARKRGEYQLNRCVFFCARARACATEWDGRCSLVATITLDDASELRSRARIARRGAAMRRDSRAGASRDRLRAARQLLVGVGSRGRTAAARTKSFTTFSLVKSP